MSEGRADYLADLLADTFRGVAGFRVIVHPKFSTLGASSFYPRGVINHHTGGGNATFESQMSYIADNSSISPLANWMTSRPRNGVVTVAAIASGKANHAGKGYLPWTGTDRGNNYAFGGEHQNDGSQAWPTQQVEAIRMGSAALLMKLGVGTGRLADHKTYAPGRKSDRHSTSLDAERKAVEALMNGSTMALTAAEEKTVKELHASLAKVKSSGHFAEPAVLLIRAMQGQMDGVAFADQMAAVARDERITPEFLRTMADHIENHPQSGGPDHSHDAVITTAVKRAVAATRKNISRDLAS